MGASDRSDYQLEIPEPTELSRQDIADCVDIMKEGEAVDPESAEQEIPLASAVAIVHNSSEIVATGAIKRIRRGYAAIVSDRAEYEFPSHTPELGDIAVRHIHQGKGLSTRLVRALLSGHDGPPFATTSNQRMKSVLGKTGFVMEGQEWDGERGRLSLWIKA